MSPMLALEEGLIRTTHFDDEMRQLADRHYSRRTVGARQFLYSGRKLVLRDAAGLVLFAWIWPDPAMRMDGQVGYNNAIFRNESSRLSSDIILEAEQAAFEKWGPNRVYTYVAPDKIASRNPGYCFKKAGALRDRHVPGRHLVTERELFQAYGLRHDAPCYETRTERPFYFRCIIGVAGVSSVELNTLHLASTVLLTPGGGGRLHLGSKTR